LEYKMLKEQVSERFSGSPQLNGSGGKMGANADFKHMEAEKE